MPTKKTRSLILSAAFLLALIIWMVSGDFLSSRSEAPEQPASTASQPFRVETLWLEAQPFQPQLRFQGQLHPAQQVEIRAETSGRVERLLVKEGQRVSQGQPLVQLAEDTRPAQLAQLRAELVARQAEVDAAQRLQTANHLARTEFLRLQSSLLQIQADLKAAELDLEFTRPRAPFAAYVNRQQLEPGDAIQQGQTLLQLVETRRLKAEAWVPQQQVQQLQEGQPVTVTLLDGQQLQGKVSVIAHQADPQTRSFRIQALLDNPDLLRLAGASATLEVELPSLPAHYFSAALLSLNDEGRLGVKTVNEQQRVAWLPVRLLSSDAQGVWVAGLPASCQVITLGGGYVKEGEEVTPVVRGDD